MALEDGGGVGSFIFGGNTGLTYEQLQQRRAIAKALATKKGGYPKNVGEGLTYLGESFADAMQTLGLNRAEAEALKRGAGMRAGAPATTYTPPEGAPEKKAETPPATTTSDVPPATVPNVEVQPAADGSDGGATSGDSGALSVADFPAVAPTAPWPVDTQATAAAAPPASLADRFAAATPPATGGTQQGPQLNDAGLPLAPRTPLPQLASISPPAQGTGGPDEQATFFNPSATRDRIATQLAGLSPAAGPVAAPVAGPDANEPVAPPDVAAAIPPAPPVSTPTVPLPRGDPRTTSGVRATMEATLARGGQSPAAIAGIERNVADESGFNPNLRHPDQPRFGGEAHFAHGLYQEGGDEWNNYVKWIDKNAPGADWRDPSLQSRFLAERLQDPQYARVNREMNAPGATPSSAAISFVQNYLKPADRYMAARTAQYAREGGDPTYANTMVAQGGPTGAAVTGERTGPGGGRAGGDYRDAVTEALLAQNGQQTPAQQPADDQTDVLRDVAGLSNRSTLPQRPTASLGRTGVTADTSLPVLAPMGGLGGANVSTAPPATPPAPDTNRDAVTQALLAQSQNQSPDVPLGDPTGAGALAPIAGGPGAGAPAPAPVPTPQQSPTIADITPMPATVAPGVQTAQAGPVPSAAIPPAGTPALPPPRTYAPQPSQDAIPAINTPAYPAYSGPPTRPPDLGPSKSMNYWLNQATNPMLSPADQQYAKSMYDQENAFRVQRQQQQDADYTNKLTIYNENVKSEREYQLKAPERLLDQQIKRLQIEKENADRANDSVTAAQKAAELGKAQEDLAKAQDERAMRVRLGGLPPEKVFEELKESKKTADASANGYVAIHNALDAINSGKVITGFGANQRLDMAKMLKFLGYTDQGSAIANTEVFRSAMAPAIASALKSTVGSTQISNADREFAEKAAAGNITLDEGTIRRMLSISQRASIIGLSRHQDMLEGTYGNHPGANAMFGVNLDIPSDKVQLLRDNPDQKTDFDKKYGKGAADYVMRRGRGAL